MFANNILQIFKVILWYLSYTKYYSGNSINHRTFKRSKDQYIFKMLKYFKENIYCKNFLGIPF